VRGGGVSSGRGRRGEVEAKGSKGGRERGRRRRMRERWGQIGRGEGVGSRRLRGEGGREVGGV